MQHIYHHVGYTWNIAPEERPIPPRNHHQPGAPGIRGGRPLHPIPLQHAKAPGAALEGTHVENVNCPDY